MSLPGAVTYVRGYTQVCTACSTPFEDRPHQETHSVMTYVNTELLARVGWHISALQSRYMCLLLVCGYVFRNLLRGTSVIHFQSRQVVEYPQYPSNSRPGETTPHFSYFSYRSIWNNFLCVDGIVSTPALIIFFPFKKMWSPCAGWNVTGIILN